MRMVKLRSAVISEVREDGTKDFSERDPVWVNADLVSKVSDHKIHVAGERIWVMETGMEIIKKLRSAE